LLLLLLVVLSAPKAWVESDVVHERWSGASWGCCCCCVTGVLALARLLLRLLLLLEV
jgi:hypothetical protein